MHHLLAQAALVGGLIAGGAEADSDGPSAAPPGAPPVQAWITVIREGLRRTSPTANTVRKTAGASLFDGSYDWHSNLFGHWVLLTHARMEGDEQLAAWTLAPLTEEALAAGKDRGRP